MTKEIIIILLLIALIYYYRQSQKPLNFTGTSADKGTDNLDKEFEEFKKTLDKLTGENEDYETEVDTLTRTKNSLEKDLTAQSNAFQARLREKDREVKKAKEDLKDLEKVRGQLTSEKQQHKGSLERIKLLTAQITNLEQEKKDLEKRAKIMPGEFPEELNSQSDKVHQEQLKAINLLFDEKAQDYAEIDFNGLYALLKGIAEREKERNRI